jgi:hypothetical protein
MGESAVTKTSTFRTTFIGAMLALASTAVVAGDGSTRMTGSDQISIGTMSIVVAPVVSVTASARGDSAAPVEGSIAVITGGAFIVSGVVQSASDVVEILLSSVASGAKLSVKISGKTVNAIGLSAGTTVQVISETTGTLLVASGKVIAFIPNALGEALFSQKRLSAQ